MRPRVSWAACLWRWGVLCRKAAPEGQGGVGWCHGPLWAGLRPGQVWTGPWSPRRTLFTSSLPDTLEPPEAMLSPMSIDLGHQCRHHTGHNRGHDGGGLIKDFLG